MFIVGTLLDGSGYSDNSAVLAQIVTFIFGIYLAFSIYNNQTKYDTVRGLLRTDDALLLAIYKMSSVLGKDIQHTMQGKIDAYLIAQLDYKLEDFKMTDKAFLDIYEYILTLEPKSAKQVETYNLILNTINQSLINRELVETHVSQRITRLEWFSILSLLGILSFYVVTLNSNGIIYAFISALLIVTSTSLTVVLYKTDNLSWRASDWIYSQLHSLFLNLDLVPYYSEPAVKMEHAQLSKGTIIRIGHYPEPYPSLVGKTVTEITI
jgi:hypothetical protein